VNTAANTAQDGSVGIDSASFPDLGDAEIAITLLLKSADTSSPSGMCWTPDSI
jgi:hypothetical protein